MYELAFDQALRLDAHCLGILLDEIHDRDRGLCPTRILEAISRWAWEQGDRTGDHEQAQFLRGFCLFMTASEGADGLS